MIDADGIVTVCGLDKVFHGGFQALFNINLRIRSGEIFALLGPNGAGKTTLIKTICGITRPSAGSVFVKGFDVTESPLETKSRIGLVPQELTTDAFETVWNAVAFSRGLFGKEPRDSYLEKLLKDLSLWDKRKNILKTLSGGMKRRLMIAKALAHEPEILFLDEPSAGVDVELRKDMWKQVRALKDSGVTIILTTHYIEEAQEMADQIGIINKGKLILVEEKNQLMKKLGKKKLTIQLQDPLSSVPPGLKEFDLTIQGSSLVYAYNSQSENIDISRLLDLMGKENLKINDLNTTENSLEEIFVSLVQGS